MYLNIDSLIITQSSIALFIQFHKTCAVRYIARKYSPILHLVYEDDVFIHKTLHIVLKHY